MFGSRKEQSVFSGALFVKNCLEERMKEEFT